MLQHVLNNIIFQTQWTNRAFKITFSFYWITTINFFLLMIFCFSWVTTVISSCTFSVLSMWKNMAVLLYIITNWISLFFFLSLCSLHPYHRFPSLYSLYHLTTINFYRIQLCHSQTVTKSMLKQIYFLMTMLIVFQNLVLQHSDPTSVM